ncbi:MAG: hypothetical protein AAGA50_31465 [Pseudomonadota bacterium]
MLVGFLKHENFIWDSGLQGSLQVFALRAMWQGLSSFTSELTR